MDTFFITRSILPNVHFELQSSNCQSVFCSIGDDDKVTIYLKKYNSTTIENERENLNSNSGVNASKQDNEKVQVNTIEDIENVDTIATVETCSNIDNEATDMFTKPRSINVTSIWSLHPHQPKTNIPFRPSKLYNCKDGGKS
ncbi:Hypothetical protein CINCED_3A012950 [Cinara cedri]|uniref:Uncharacterized protein n=1 Tax=Cinara cedri TaxID=506608 RepID=A0A5E4NNT2_9HEMI|nr:Hypothetical protein CINCED_3A012950 [Cinara cedri]